MTYNHAVFSVFPKYFLIDLWMNRIVSESKLSYYISLLSRKVLYFPAILKVFFEIAFQNIMSHQSGAPNQSVIPILYQ